MKLDIIEKRHSVRSFREVPLSESDVTHLKAELTMINSHEAGINLHLVVNDRSVLSSVTKSYGFFRNAVNYIVAIVDYNYSDVLERAGYFAESAVLAATEMGLGTCFIGGTYDKDAINVPLRAGQDIVFVVAVGYPSDLYKPSFAAKMAVKLSHLKKMSPEDFYVERDGWPLKKACKEFPFLKNGLRALAAAPSSLNRRPVRVWIGKKDDVNVVRIGIPDMKEKQLIDLGIAKSNFCASEGGIFDWGNGAAYYPEE